MNDYFSNTSSIGRRRLLLGMLGLAAAASMPLPGFAATAAEDYVSRIGNSVIAAANNGSVSQFRSVMRANADIASIAIFSLGPYRKNLGAGQRQEYFRLVEQYISSVFVAHSSKLKGQKLQVVGSRNVGQNVVVDSRLQSPDGRNTHITWRLLKRGGGYKIFDINVGGIWLASTQKTNFTSVLQKNKGDVNALLAYLRQQS
jgi:phospholipid transport system substrate-binding protein